ncbi:conjugal transfer protein TraF [Planctomycetales bacterium]|nr:conjugal transfer protein TraF [Planctomycetales bacterium]GHT04941.1 conjugal transfer protein TraF [Planctomycetales bacterium]
MTRRRKTGWVIAAVVLTLAAHFGGLRFNYSRSMPRGLYWLTDRNFTVGDLVAYELPAFDLAVERGYTPGVILKRVVAGAGDTVSINRRGVFVSGQLLPHSVPRDADGAGRLLPRIELDGDRLRAGDVLLLGDTDKSYDSRYFGIVPARRIVARAIPLWLFDD